MLSLTDSYVREKDDFRLPSRYTLDLLYFGFLYVQRRTVGLIPYQRLGITYWSHLEGSNKNNQ